MRRYLTASLAISIGIASASLSAQVSVSQEQLDKGYLGDQNARLTASQGNPSEASFQVRAIDAIARKDYARALSILRPYRMSDPLAYRWLAGQAYLGQGNYAAARKEFAAAVKARKNFTSAQVALGMVEAQHGDKPAARAIVQNLTARRNDCAVTCKDNAELANGIVTIEAALKARPD